MTASHLDAVAGWHSDYKSTLHLITRQNELEWELLEAALAACGK